MSAHADDLATAHVSSEADVVLRNPQDRTFVISTAEELENRTAEVRMKFEAILIAEGEAQETAEQNNASLLAIGFRNALEWLDNRKLLIERLVKVGMAPANDNTGLLGQIAKLQLGSWQERKDKGQVWVVRSRRDERVGRFYRIFFAQPEKFPVERLEEVILNYPKRSGGILADASPKKKAPSKAEIQKNRELAAKAQPLETVRSNTRVGKIGEYQLVLVRQTSGGFDICEIIDNEPNLTERLANRYAAEVAMTVPSDQ
jgi:hypothetical protein